MDILKIVNPTSDDVKYVVDGVIEFGLSQVNGVEPDQWVIHAIEDGEIVGGATGRIHFSQLYLDNLWVKKELRNQGLGTKIHEEVVQLSKQSLCSRIQLNTLNEKAVQLYKRLDYEILAEIDGYVDGFCLYYMARKI